MTDSNIPLGPLVNGYEVVIGFSKPQIGTRANHVFLKTTMEDYDDASDRHFQDAKTLHDQVPSRLANASHLYGISAECALKCILERNGRVPKGKTGHLPNLLVEFENHSAAKGNARLLNQLKKHAGGLKSWHIGQRYFAQATFQKEVVKSEAESARKIRVLSHHHSRGII